VGAPYDPRVNITGAGRPLVLVSGLDGTGQLFYTQVPRLARTFRVATYWLRDSATEMATLVADLRAVLDTVAPGGEPAILLGESFGGALSLSFALAHPERVAALVILNSFPAFLPQFRLRLGRAALSALPWGAMALVRRLTAFRMHSRHTTPEELRRFLELMGATTREGYLNRLGVLMQYDVRDQLNRVRAPTLFLAADRDHLVPSVEQARYMAARVPGASMRVLEGHGHICLLAPDLDIAAILGEWAPLRDPGVSRE
jgi:3-oxoadipate enol-lactonase